VTAGLKKTEEPDLGLIFSDREATAAGVFTSNRVKAAPVLLSREHIREGRARAIIANAGNANACTGPDGLGNAQKTAEIVAENLGIGVRDVLVASTGVIGAPLNMARILPAVPKLARSLTPDGLSDVAGAIMTTDKFPKVSGFKGESGGKPFHIAGMAKGAGMIMPDLATMLCFLLTDIRMDHADLQASLRGSVGRTFNRITVDGDTSTNDTVLILANGMAENPPLAEADRRVFRRGLTRVMDDLATMIVADGEGATKVVDIVLKGAASPEDALKAARTIANSALVKTAFYGQDPNWGRIMAAVGRSGVSMTEERVDIWVNDVHVVEGGLGRGSQAETGAAEQMKEKRFAVTVDLHRGSHEERVKTCDLTREYVGINADYRT
jgi:glutamate N-acetyltransferase/amino-acid N-acetyltransferase